MVKKYKTEEKAPSELFLDSTSYAPGITHGSYEMECGWCDRLHMCPDVHWGFGERDFEDAENFRQHAENMHKENPEGVVLHYGVDCVTGAHVNGINFVLLCPCNGLAKYETFIWTHRDMIREYLKKRIDQEYDFAQQEKVKNKLAGVDRTISIEGFWNS